MAMSAAGSAQNGYVFTYFPKVVVEKGWEIHLDTSLPIMTKKSMFEELLNMAQAIEHGVLVNPKFVMVHPANRSGFGINAHNSHRIGALIKRVGADFDELKSCWLFEVSGVPKQREAQLDFNEKLVRAADGKLAPLNSAEKFLSVSKSHTFALARAVTHCCKTDNVELAGADGHIDAQRLRRDAKFAKMLDEGWQVRKVNWEAEATWPFLPDLIQRACNAANDIPSPASELEVACSIATFAKNAAHRGDTVDWGACMEAAIAASPRCGSYASVLKELAFKFGGGPDAPVIHMMDAFSNKYCPNVILGEDFLRAVVETTFLPDSQFPLARAAMLLVNLTSPKVVDGVARLASRSDVLSLAGKAKVQQLLELEADLQTAKQWLLELKRENIITDDSELDLTGVFFIRNMARHAFYKHAHENRI